MTDDRIHRVLAPKMTGATLLDRMTRTPGPDFFLMYSSASALLGNIEQAPYAGANLPLEALAHDRRRAGLPALAIQFSAITDAGYVERSGMADELEAMGLGSSTTEIALTAADSLLADPDTSVVHVGAIDLAALQRYLPRPAAPRTASLLPARDPSHTARKLRDSLADATGDEAHTLGENALAGLLADVLQTTPEHLDRTQPLASLGADSLMNAELATLIRRHLDCELPVVELAGAGNLSSLAHRLLSRLGHRTDRD
ncbi:KR domain-containing protein [Streptomyces sp. NPDC087844]|uniref:KR domain-containing protein n=1 Tax=Streptomyces sp. NPDC087844 TaxID=3365805 RepID=UPI00382CFA32